MRFYVGTYSVPGSPGIAICEVSGERLHLVSSYAALQNPTWLTASQDGRRLYVAARVSQEEASVASLAVGVDGLLLLSEQSSGGGNTCHLTLDRDERLLLASHYGNGRLSVFPVAEGHIGPPLQVIQHRGSGPVGDQLTGPHAHHTALRPGSDEVFACDLGCDRIFLYSLQERLLAMSQIALPPGTGPRHLVFSGPDRFYVCGELDSSVTYFSLLEGLWHPLQRLSTLPEGFGPNSCAAIRLQGDRLYVSNRGHDSIAAFKILEDGRLLFDAHIPAGGQWPRDFVPYGEGFLIANQKSGTLCYAAMDGRVIDSLNIPGAVCVAGIRGAG
ncbi:MAG: lactonase family protein [Christensenellales bacterium]